MSKKTRKTATPAPAAPKRFDPVEDAKVAAQPAEGDEGHALPEPASAASVLAPTEPPAPPVVPGPAPAPGRPPGGGKAPRRLPLWRVVKAAAVQVRGQRQHLAAGKLLDEESYGTETIASLREQGVELEEIPREV